MATQQITPTRDTRGIHIGDRNYSVGSHELTLVNPEERDWKRHNYILWFGACGATYLRVWEDSLEDALETAAAWLAEHAPGHIMAHGSEEHVELIKEQCEEHGVEFDPSKCCGVIEEPWDSILQDAEADLTYTESGFLTSHEWGIVMEDPSRKELIEWLGE